MKNKYKKKAVHELNQIKNDVILNPLITIQNLNQINSNLNKFKTLINQNIRQINKLNDSLLNSIDSDKIEGDFNQNITPVMKSINVNVNNNKHNINPIIFKKNNDK